MTVGYMAQYKCFIIIIIIININSKTISPINLVMVSSERAIMYLLITAFNNISNVVCWLRDSNIHQIFRWNWHFTCMSHPSCRPSSFSGQMRRSSALFRCWPKHEHVPSACFLTTLPCGSEDKQAVHKISPSMTSYTNSWKFYDGLFLSFYY